VKLARLQRPEMATPVLAVSCDDVCYEVAELERRWRGSSDGDDFFARVVAARGAGLDELHARLTSGQRPTEARLLDGEYLPLPPFDPARGAYVQLGPSDRPAPVVFQHRDARALVGDGQPVPLKTGRAFVEVGLAVLLGDDLDHASAHEAMRSVLGFSLVIDWTAGDPWISPFEPQPPSQLGRELVVRPRLDSLLDRPLIISVDDAHSETRPIAARSQSIGESLAYLSQHVALCAGDLVGLGCVAGGRIEVAPGQRVQVRLRGGTSLAGWGARAC
jgi:hypothetical protein